MLAIRAAPVLARARGQTALLAKPRKGEGPRDGWRRADPARIRREAAARLVAMAPRRRPLLAGGRLVAGRPPTKAAQAVGAHAIGPLLVFAFRAGGVAGPPALGRRLAAGRRLDRRRRTPRPFHLLTDPARGGLARCGREGTGPSVPTDSA